jgi:CMP-N-acetylneuraminic acid synthetase
MKVVAFVPIRLNSKRVVGKNLKLLGAKPLMWYILETLTRVPQINEV